MNRTRVALAVVFGVVVALQLEVPLTSVFAALASPKCYASTWRRA